MIRIMIGRDSESQQAINLNKGQLYQLLQNNLSISYNRKTIEIQLKM